MSYRNFLRYVRDNDFHKHECYRRTSQQFLFCHNSVLLTKKYEDKTKGIWLKKTYVWKKGNRTNGRLPKTYTVSVVECAGR